MAGGYGQGIYIYDMASVCLFLEAPIDKFKTLQVCAINAKPWLGDMAGG